jgi:hypothetical protein
MAETTKLGLPLVEGGQAQKHVTVNEALVRIDALAQPVVLTAGLASPPPEPHEGDLHVVGVGAVGEWAGRDGGFALWSNGGWDFAAPALGQRAWFAPEGRPAVFDGVSWVPGDGGIAYGAATALRIAAIDHEVEGAPTSTTTAFIPDKAIVLGVTARVLVPLHGPGLTGWSLGVVADHSRYGSGYGLGAGSFAHGVTGAPQAYYGGAPLVLAGEGGPLAGGRVRLCVHYLDLTPPRA